MTMLSMPLRLLLVAAACYTLPLAMVPFARPNSGAPEWRLVSTWAGGERVSTVHVVTQGDAERLYAIGATSGLWVSADRGTHWLRADRGLLHDWTGGVALTALAVNPANGDELYALIDSSPSRPRPMLYWSQNGGMTWMPRGSLGPRHFYALAFSPSGEDLYLVTANEVMRAYVRDLGRRTFFRGAQDEARALVASLGTRHPASALVAVPNDVIGHQTGLDRCAEAPITLYVGTAGDGIRVLNGEGETMALAESLDEDTLHVRSHAAIHTIGYLASTDVLYAGTDRGIYASKDGGVSWYHTAYDLRDRAVYSLIIDHETKHLYVGVADGGAYISADQGATWQPLGAGLGRATVLSLALDADRDILYAGTDRGLWFLEPASGAIMETG